MVCEVKSLAPIKAPDGTPLSGDQTAAEVPANVLGYSEQTGGVLPSVQDNIVDLQRDKIGFFSGIAALSTPTTVDVRYRTAQHASATGTDHTSTIPSATPTSAGVMTAAQATKLDSLVANYRGVYNTVALLTAAHPTGTDGDWAIVRNPTGPAQHYSWDSNSSSWESVDLTSITGTTNLAYSWDGTSGILSSDTGQDAIIPQADAVTGGIVSPSQFLYWNTQGGIVTANATKLSGIEDGATADQVASEVPFVPAGNIGATNTQAAIEELDTEKVQITSTSIIINVAVGDSIQDAINSLNDYIFTGSAVGTVMLAAGPHTLPASLVFQHPQPSKIVLRGAASTPSVRSDYGPTKATNRAVFSVKYPTTVLCPVSILTSENHEDVNMRDIGFIHDNGTHYGADVRKGTSLRLTNVGMFGFYHGIIARNSAIVSMSGCVVINSANHGIAANYMCQMTVNNTIIVRNVSVGLYLFNFNLLEGVGSVVSDNGSAGIVCQLNSAVYVNSYVVSNNNGYGVQASLNSGVYVSGGEAKNNLYSGLYGDQMCVISAYNVALGGNFGATNNDINITNSSQCLSSGCSSSSNGSAQLYYQSFGTVSGWGGTVSPPINTTGNDGSKWR